MLSAATGSTTTRTSDDGDDAPDEDFAEDFDEDFLDAMAALAGGVCVVTTAGPGGRPAGFTSTAVMSLSRSPRLVAVAVDERSRTLPLLLGTGRFALNLLHAAGEGISRRFADKTNREERFNGLEGVAWTMESPALPLLMGHSSYVLTCRVTKEISAGDHRLLVAAIERILPGAGGPGALVHLGRRYHALDALDDAA
ncbi:flavin reductase family protein [Streptomyces sp. 6N223]|uniref:flavin reductase family protein n=1 Tax=Streptomyces sp. 6N223 TaxID=3457412 RepID=UPI003FD13B7B